MDERSTFHVIDGRAAPYVARILQQQLADDPQKRHWTVEGTAAIADITGFTQLSEQLARKGREGAEQITDAIGASFEAVLRVAYESGGSLLKFGGDALLLWFDGPDHAARACVAVLAMRSALEAAGRIDVPGAQVALQMTQGVHSGMFHFFAAGTAHVELLPTGPAWSRAVAMERGAAAGEILVSPQTVLLVPGASVGDARVAGVPLLRAPPGHDDKRPLRPRPALAAELLQHCLSPAIRAHVAGGGGNPEHRPVTIAFVGFDGVDALIAERGAADAAAALHALVNTVGAATAEQDIAFLGSDVGSDGGKLILTAGAPKVTGDDEERMLLAVRRIIEADLPLPVRIGVHRGAVFAGDIGPVYRRTYTVMGDAVNLTARLMAKAERGQIYATADVLDRSNTLFATTPLSPFAVKGKTEPVRAWALGSAQGSRTRQVTSQRLPLTGRNAELGLVRKAFASARAGAGRVLEVVGEAGVGKTRLLEALRDAAVGFDKASATCEAYTASTPYIVWRELLRAILQVDREMSDAMLAERVAADVAERAPEIVPWLALLGAVLDVEIAPTIEVEMLAEKNRRAKLHETLAGFLAVMAPPRLLLEIENAQHMDEASAELLCYLADMVGERHWLFAVARRPIGTGFVAPETPAVIRVDLKPLALADATRLAQLATAGAPLPPHMLDVVARRSGGNPQFLRDLVRTAIESGNADDLPDSAEAAAMALIDALAPDDRALVRRAAVFGLGFHPRMLPWLYGPDDGPAPPAAAFARLGDLFSDEADGYLRFRHTLLRDAAYQGLPFRLRRQLHHAVAAHLEAEADFPDEAGDTLSLHYLAAGDYPRAWHYATTAALRAEKVYAYVEAALLYARAIEAGRNIANLAPLASARAYESLADSWYRAGEYRKALEAYTTARGQVAGEALLEANLLLKLSRVEEKLGQYPEALRWVDRAREALAGAQGLDAARHTAQASAWYATVLLAQGHTDDALRWAEQAAREADEVDDAESLGTAYFVMGGARGVRGEEGGEALMLQSLEAFRRSGNRVRQASILSNLGAACYWEGRWDDAMAYYERGREESLRVGNLVHAAAARLNVAEILTDRGELAEAESLLQQTLPLWKSSEYRYFLGACHWMLGRVSLRANRIDEALARFDDARSRLAEVGAEYEVLDIDARVAECRLLQGDAAAALARADALLGRTDAAEALVRLTPLLQRVRGYAVLLQGDPFGAREAFEVGLALARERNEPFELALTLNALTELDRLEGVEPPQEMLDESRALLAKLKVRALPPTPALA